MNKTGYLVTGLSALYRAHPYRGDIGNRPAKREDRSLAVLVGVLAVTAAPPTALAADLDAFPGVGATPSYLQTPDAAGSAPSSAPDGATGSPASIAQAGEPPMGRQLAAADDDPDAHPERLLPLLTDSADMPAASADELDMALGQRRVFSDLRTLADRINADQRPTANAVIRYSSQSDDLEIRQAEVSQDLFFSHGLTDLRLGAQAIDYDPRYGRTIGQRALGVDVNHRFDDFLAFSGDLWVNRLRGPAGHDTKVTYDAFLTLRPSDSIRIDIDTNRRLFDNVRSLQLGLTATSYGGSIDFTPMDDLRLTARGSYGRYSDGNRRRTEEVEAVWKVSSRPIVEIGARGTNFNFSRLLDNGYFNPKNYYSGGGMVRVRTTLARKLTVELAGSAGVENARPGGTKPLFSGSLQLAYMITDRWSLDGEFAHFSSRQSTSSGFSRTSASLGLHYRF